MPKNSNIRVSRFNHAELPDGAACADGTFAWEASVTGGDGSWVLFTPTPEAMARGVVPQLWHRVGTYTDEAGAEQDSYALDGSPEHQAFMEHGGQLSTFANTPPLDSQ